MKLMLLQEEESKDGKFDAECPACDTEFIITEQGTIKYKV